ncbi:MAG: GlsB/YeaQ/YmgE family stress response membrane protein [Acidimicrobiales bacterium]
MTVFGWVVVGLLAGGFARLATGSEKQGCLGTLVIGILGALIGGALFRLATGEETNVFDEFQLGSVLVAFVGAAALLFVLQTIGVRSRHGHGHSRRRRR